MTREKIRCVTMNLMKGKNIRIERKLVQKSKEKNLFAAFSYGPRKKLKSIGAHMANKLLNPPASAIFGKGKVKHEDAADGADSLASSSEKRVLEEASVNPSNVAKVAKKEPVVEEVETHFASGIGVEEGKMGGVGCEEIGDFSGGLCSPSADSAAFSFSGPPKKLSSIGAHLVNKFVNPPLSAFVKPSAHPRSSAKSHSTAVYDEGKVKREDAADGSGALESRSGTRVLKEAVVNPGKNVAKVVKTEPIEEEVEPHLKSRIEVKEETMDAAVCAEIEDLCGGLRIPSADSNLLNLKNTRVTRQSVKRKKFGSTEVQSPPPHWEEVMQKIRIMRTGRDAPVDLLGPAQLVDANADAETRKFHVLVSAMISSQTRDAVTAAAMKRLHAWPGGLTLEHIAESDVSVEILEELLKPVGFYRQKARQLKTMAEILLKPPYCGCVPSTLDELMKLPGVGPKVGLLVLWVGFGKVTGLIVDTNVRRVCCRLGWASEGSSAEQVRQNLESWLPKDLWAEASFLLVGFGQQICKPIGPNCKECQVSRFCPSAFKVVKKVNT